MPKKMIITTVATVALFTMSAMAGGQGGGLHKTTVNEEMMAKNNCAAIIKKMEGMIDEKHAKLREKAKKKLEEGDEKGCIETVKNGMVKIIMNNNN